MLWRTWGEASADVVYVGTYRDFKGARASIWVHPDDPGQVWLLDHDLAPAKEGIVPSGKAGDPATLAKHAAGTRGVVSFYEIRMVDRGGTPQPVPGSTAKKNAGRPLTEGTFVSFDAKGTSVTPEKILKECRDPWLIGLLTAVPAVRDAAYQKIVGEKDEARKVRALSGLVTAGALDLAEKYLAANPQKRTAETLGNPDFHVLVPWIARGLDGTPAGPFTDRDLDGSLVLHLIPAAKEWRETKSAEKTREAFYDTVLGRQVSLLFPLVFETDHTESMPEPAYGPFERGQYHFSSVLEKVAPDFAKAVRDAEFHFLGFPAHTKGMWVLGTPTRAGSTRLEVFGGAGWLFPVIASPPKAIPFGSRADVLIRVEDRFRHGADEGSILTMRLLPPDPAGLIAYMKQYGLGQNVGWLARWIQEGKPGITWKDLDEMLGKLAAQEDGNYVEGLQPLSVFGVHATPEIAERIWKLLPAYSRKNRYTDVAAYGATVAAVYAKSGRYDLAKKTLDELPAVIRAGKDTYDGKGDTASRSTSISRSAPGSATARSAGSAGTGPCS